MKVLATDIFIKRAGSWDDQPNFWKPRYEREQGSSLFLDNTTVPESTDDIKSRWGKKKKKKMNRRYRHKIDKEDRIEKMPKPSI